MIVRCPKCHFSQPADEYCAQCGCNMRTYKPPQQPIMKKILGSFAFQVSALVVIGGAGAFIILQKNAPSGSILSQRVSKIRQSAFSGSNGKAENQQLQAVANSETQPTGMTTAESTSTTVSDADSSSLARGVPAAEGDSAAGAAIDAKKKADLAPSTVAFSKGGAPAPLLNPRSVKITYAEISPRGFEVLTEESRSSGQFNSFADYSAGVVVNVAKKIATIPKDFKVVSTEILQIENGKPLQTQVTYKDRNREPASADMQLATNVHLDSDGTTLRADVEILKSGKGDQTTANYPASFDVMSDTGYFISGFHHGKTAFEAERVIDSELVVLVEFNR